MTLTIYAGIFTEVPASIGSLKLLKKLCLGGSQSVSLPTSLSKLTALEDLHVTTDLQNFAVVEHLNKLTKLAFFPHMEEEVIVSYPEFVWTFTSLQILLLVQSSVASLPDAFGNLKQLKVLYLGSHFSLESLPESFGNLTCLTDLCIINCPRLLNLPESIGNLQLLTRLEISSCRHITTLPDSTGNLQRLEELILTNDEVFERLPSSIGNLHALKLLIVEDAGEVFLFPESFADLVLDKPIEECSLEKVFFQGEMKLVAAGPRVTMALNLLKERGVLQLYCGQGFGFP
jgi:Leucine-rich repeat (LRR) protein